MSEENTAEAPTNPRTNLAAEFREFWDFLPRKHVFAVLAISWLLLFQFLGNSTFGYIDTPSLFTWMFAAYNAQMSEDSHGNLIPFVVLGLIWWKRRELMSLRLEPWHWALPMFVVAVVLHSVGFVAQQPRISILALFFGFYAIMGLCWGRSWLKHTFFPYFLVIFCVPIGSLAQGITFPLRMLVTQLSVGFASIVLGLEIVREGTLIFDADKSFQYDVAPACSGIRSLITLFALTTIYGFITYQTMWRRLVMMAVSVPLAVLGNVLRVITVIVVGDVYGMKAGLNIEQKLGLVTFLVAIVGVMVLGYFLDEKRSGMEKQNES
ncbi:MAG: hypothetical protein M2R45_02116 [Verrucomicrobia subdivision 3 bacterium]|nr:hypothetical protein [Limisphaerales bacterium]MCS1413825.1 hypothetical protein [Limisphaerales bacterium]